LGIEYGEVYRLVLLGDFGINVIEMTRLKVTIRTVGCRANQADSATLGRCLDPSSVEIVDEFAGADLIVINTCCVTSEAERDCR
jgi:tRNA A37 methylthiotransferase MiaB